MTNIQESISNLSTDIVEVSKNIIKMPPNRNVMNAIAHLRLMNKQGTTHIINYYEERIEDLEDRISIAKDHNTFTIDHFTKKINEQKEEIERQKEEIERQKQEIERIKFNIGEIYFIKGIGEVTFDKICKHMNL